MHEHILNLIQDAVRDDRYRFSEHALDELDADDLHPIDAESALLTGRIFRVQPDESSEPGPRYTVVGHATDGTTPVGVICRFDPIDRLLIITCFEKRP